ncbi:MAG TPA: hypothetical protein VK041_06775 [Opitutales bacterium]|nr:hypothetical protein [Opitutales bacterium]
MKRGKHPTHSGRGLLLTFLFIFFVGSFGLTTVWLRQQIAASGAKTSSMERRLVELERLESRLTGEIAIAVSPGYLEEQNQRFRLGLRRATDDQVVYIDGPQQIRFAENRWEQLVRVPEEKSLTFYLSDPN